MPGLPPPRHIPTLPDSAVRICLGRRLAPYPAEEMVAWPVSARVGNVKNNDASLIEPIAGAG
jgi:hypothetical protein